MNPAHKSDMERSLEEEEETSSKVDESSWQEKECQTSLTTEANISENIEMVEVAKGSLPTKTGNA